MKSIDISQKVSEIHDILKNARFSGKRCEDFEDNKNQEWCKDTCLDIFLHGDDAVENKQISG